MHVTFVIADVEHPFAVDCGKGGLSVIDTALTVINPDLLGFFFGDFVAVDFTVRRSEIDGRRCRKQE